MPWVRSGSGTGATRGATELEWTRRPSGPPARAADRRPGRHPWGPDGPPVHVILSTRPEGLRTGSGESGKGLRMCFVPWAIPIVVKHRQSHSGPTRQGTGA